MSSLHTPKNDAARKHISIRSVNPLAALAPRSRDPLRLHHAIMTGGRSSARNETAVTAETMDLEHESSERYQKRQMRGGSSGFGGPPPCAVKGCSKAQKCCGARQKSQAMLRPTSQPLRKPPKVNDHKERSALKPFCSERIHEWDGAWALGIGKSVLNQRGRSGGCSRHVNRFTHNESEPALLAVTDKTFLTSRDDVPNHIVTHTNDFWQSDHSVKQLNKDVSWGNTWKFPHRTGLRQSRSLGRPLQVPRELMRGSVAEYAHRFWR
jgi:hypothetical protein